MKRLLLSTLILGVSLHAFSTTNVQYLYGNFAGPTFLDSRSGNKQTVTLEHFNTWSYGDLYTFVDSTYASQGLQFTGDKNEFYGEFSPRVSLNKLTGSAPSEGIIKEWYLASQYNGSSRYHAWLYGAGVDLSIPKFSIFSLNVYRKIQNILDDTYQLSVNYALPLGERWHCEGFLDWTGRDMLSQNQLLFDLAPTFGMTKHHLEIGTEWHHYEENTHHTVNNVLQEMVKYRW
jgi:nucleoside-specific outer membrane channel protein Tsx